MSSDSTSPEDDLLKLLETNAEETNGKKSRDTFRDIADIIMNLWARNHRNSPVWPPNFQERVAELIRQPGNISGFQSYLLKCEIYALRSAGDGFPNSCDMRTGIQLIVDEFVPFKDLVHPDDEDQLEFIDEIYTQIADQIPPIPPEKIPSWTPESHWWWRAPTNHNMSQEEIDRKLYDYYPEDWNNR